MGPFYGVFKFKPGSSDLEKKLGTIEAFFFLNVKNMIYSDCYLCAFGISFPPVMEH